MLEIKNQILKELISVGDKLKREYNNSDLDFDIITQNLALMLKNEKVPVLFIFKDGHYERKMMFRNSFRPYYEEIMKDPVDGVYKAEIKSDEDTVDYNNERIRRFRFQGFEEPFVYIEC
jgi:hypothetical protein